MLSEPLTANTINTTGEIIFPPTASIGLTAMTAPMLAIKGARNEMGRA